MRDTLAFDDAAQVTLKSPRLASIANAVMKRENAPIHNQQFLHCFPPAPLADLLQSKSFRTGSWRSRNAPAGRAAGVFDGENIEFGMTEDRAQA